MSRRNAIDLRLLSPSTLPAECCCTYDRSGGLHSLNNREPLAEALLSSPAMHRSRSLGIAETTAVATASAVGGSGGSGGTAKTAETMGKRARVGYLIMASGVEELHKTKRLLQVIRPDADITQHPKTEESGTA